MKNKKASHISFVIAFMLFITFVIFLFMMLHPAVRIDEEEKAVLNHLSKEIIEQASAELVVVDVTASSGDCLKIDLNEIGLNNFDLDVSKLDSNNISVKDSARNDVNFELTDGDLKFERDNIGFFKIFISDAGGFSYPGTVSCSGILQIPDTGLVRKEKYVFKNKFMELTDEDYDTLKTRLDIANEDFSFSLLDSEKNPISGTETTNPSPKDKSVYAELFPITYVDENADRKAGHIKVVVW